MFWTVLAIVTLVALGGFIAYYGDLTGRRWGKKRVSWFGLRPKYTAILITSFTGSFIVLVSILTLIAISQPVREVLLNGERAIRENKQLNARLVGDRKAYETQLKDTQAQIAQVQTELGSRTADLKRIQAEVTRLLAENNVVLNKNRTLQQERKILEGTLQKEQMQVRTLQVARRSLEKQNRVLDAQIERSGEINRDLADENVRLTRLNAQQEKEYEKLVDTNQKLLASVTDLRKQEEDLRQLNMALTHDGDALTQANTELNAKVSSLQRQQDDLLRVQDQLYGLALSGRDYAQTYLALRRGRLILNAGEMIARRIIPAHPKLGDVRRDLLGLLQDASELARRRGAMVGENRRAVRILTKRIDTPRETAVADESDSLSALAENLMASRVPVLVTVNVLLNSVEGEQTIVDLTARSIAPAFEKGQTVASRKLDSTQSPETLTDQIVQFLQQDVRDAAIRAGVVPQIDPETGAKSVGILRPDELVTLANRVRRTGGEVMLTAITSASANTAEPLRLHFKVTRL